MKTKRQALAYRILFSVLISASFMWSGCNDLTTVETQDQARTYRLQFLNGTTGEPVLQGETGRATLSASNFLDMTTIDLGPFSIDEDGFATVRSEDNNSCFSCRLKIQVNKRYYVPESHSSGVYRIYKSDSGSIVLKNWYKGLKETDTMYYAVRMFGEKHPTFYKQTYPFSELVQTLRARTEKVHHIFYALNEPLHNGYDFDTKKFTLDKNLYVHGEVEVLDDPETTDIRFTP